MLLRPTRIRAKFGGFHISAPGYAKNAPDFTHPNKDTPKTCPVLDPNLWRGTFRGVCNTPLHGYVQNPAGFGLCHTTWRKTRRVLDSATRHSAKPGGFHIPAHDMARNPAGFGLCHTTWRKTRRVFHIATRLSETRRVLLTPKSKSTLLERRESHAAQDRKAAESTFFAPSQGRPEKRSDE